MGTVSSVWCRSGNGGLRPFVLAVAVAAAWVPAASAASADWAPPVTVSTAHDSIGPTKLISGAAGDLLAWGFSDRSPVSGGIGSSGASYAVAPANSGFGPERHLSDQYQPDPLVDLGGGRVARLIYSENSNGGVKVAFGDVRGTFGKPRTITGSIAAQSLTMAGNERGDLVAAWVSSPRPSHRDVWVRVQPAGRSFGAPQRLATGLDGDLAVAAIGKNGDAVVVYDAKVGRLLARTLLGRRGTCRPTNPHGCSIAGRTWGAQQDIGPAARLNVNAATPRVDADGRVTVAWFRRQTTEGGSGPSRVEVAVRPPGARRFLPEQRLYGDPDPLALTGAPLVLTDDGQRHVIAFVASAPSPVAGADPISVVKVAYSRRDHYGAPATISAAGQNAGGLAAADGPRGAIVVWSAGATPSTLRGRLFAAVTDLSTHRFGAPQQMADADHALSTAATYSPSSDRWIVAWGSLPDLATRSGVVRTSFCRAACQ